MNEDGDRPYDNEANERCHVHKEPDERNVVASEEPGGVTLVLPAHGGCGSRARHTCPAEPAP